jgi:general secretion pathway protein K
MRVGSQQPTTGFAIIVVLIVIMALGILAGGFALSMKVEMRLAANAGDDAEMEWLGRSGVEMARFVLGQSSPQFASLNQIWAGGPGAGPETNGVLMTINLNDNELGDGRFSVRIVDQERKFGINLNLPEQQKRALLDRALTLIGLDSSEGPTIADSILDWIDVDEASHLNGTESDFYQTLPWPYTAKNGPIDDPAELLLVRGVTPEIYWGPAAAHHRQQTIGASRDRALDDLLPSYPVGLVDLFTALSSGRLNINTASAQTLQLLPGVDESVAANIIRARSGLDGVEGTEDDTPFLNVAMLSPATVPNLIPELAAQYTALCGVASTTFEVQVDAQLGRNRRTYVALVRRASANDVQILQFGWH